MDESRQYRLDETSREFDTRYLLLNKLVLDAQHALARDDREAVAVLAGRIAGVAEQIRALTRVWRDLHWNTPHGEAGPA
jgi:hypothetical protein